MFLEIAHQTQVLLGFFGDALDDDVVAGREPIERDLVRVQATQARDRVAVRTGCWLAERSQQVRLDLGRQCVLDAVRLLVRLVPAHVEQVGQQPLGERVSAHRVLGHAPTRLREDDGLAGLMFDQAIAFHALQGGGDRGRGHPQTFGEAGGDDRHPIARHEVDMLEIVFDDRAGHAGMSCNEPTSDLLTSTPPPSVRSRGARPGDGRSPRPAVAPPRAGGRA